MGAAIGATIGYAVGVALSPIPIAAVILMLFSARARVNSVVFMITWILGIATVVTAMQLLPGLEAGDDEPGNAAGWIKVALGVALLVLAIRQWHSRPEPDGEVASPKWMETIDGLKPPAAGGLGFVLSALNPKNLLLAAAAGASFASMGLDGDEAAGATVVFTLVAASTVVVPVGGYLVAGRRLDHTLDAAKEWLIRNNAAVMSVLFVVFGFSVVGDGIQILTG